MAVDRAALGTTAGAVFQSLIQVTDSLNLTRVNVPVRAVATSFAGLWVGAASVTNVDEVLTRGTVVNTKPTQPTQPRAAFPIRLILHAAAGGTTTLLPQVFLGQAANGAPTASPRESVVKAVATSRIARLSSAAFPIEMPVTTSAGGVGLSNTVTYTVVLPYDSATNPFLHAYHPDHDNLDARFTQKLANKAESYTVTRVITLAFQPSLAGVSESEPTWGSTTWAALIPRRFPDCARRLFMSPASSSSAASPMFRPSLLNSVPPPIAMKSTSSLLVLFLFLATFAPLASAQTVAGPPAKIDYQGKVLDSTGAPLAPVTPTNYTMLFRIYGAQAGGTPLWSETQTVTVSNGLFSVRLGEGVQYLTDNHALNAAAVFAATDRFLGLTVDTTVGDTTVANFTEITPRLTFLSSPFAFVAQTAVTAQNVNQTTGTASFAAANLQTATVQNLTINGNLTGNGSALTNLTGSNLTAGSVTAAKLGADVGLWSVNGANVSRLTGNVGIGIAAPVAARLDVRGSVAASGSFFQYSYDANAGVHGGFITASNRSNYADGDIVSQSFFVISDARTKNIKGRSDGAQDLRTLQDIQVTDYTMVDTVAKGSGRHKKVIAQQVQKVFPEAISISTDVVPDIYRKATIQHGWVKLATNLKQGERVRLVAEKHEGIHEVLEVSADGFRTDFAAEGDQVFVYGREVHDFLTVDYDAIAMLNVSATQQIKKEKDAEVKALQEENAALRNKLAAQEQRLAALEAKDKTRDGKLAAIEKLLLSSGKPEIRSASLK